MQKSLSEGGDYKPCEQSCSIAAKVQRCRISSFAWVTARFAVENYCFCSRFEVVIAGFRWLCTCHRSCLVTHVAVFPRWRWQFKSRSFIVTSALTRLNWCLHLICMLDTKIKWWSRWHQIFPIVGLERNK